MAQSALGVGLAHAQNFRFGVGLCVAAAKQPVAISWVLAGGVAGASEKALLVISLSAVMCAPISDRLVGTRRRRLGKAYEVLGRPADAVSAMVSAADAAPQDADQQIAGLQAIMTSDLGGQYITQASRLIERAVPLAPGRLDLLFLRGHFAKLAGNTEKARDLWQSLLQQLPADSPFADDLKTAILKKRLC